MEERIKSLRKLNVTNKQGFRTFTFRVKSYLTMVIRVPYVIKVSPYLCTHTSIQFCLYGD